MSSSIKFTCTAIACIATSNFASAVTLSMHPVRPMRPTTGIKTGLLPVVGRPTCRPVLGAAARSSICDTTHIDWQPKNEIRSAWPSTGSHTSGGTERVKVLDTVHKDWKMMNPASTTRSSSTTGSVTSRTGGDICATTHINRQLKGDDSRRCNSATSFFTSTGSNLGTEKSSTSKVFDVCALTHINRGQGLLPKAEAARSPLPYGAGGDSPKLRMNAGRRLVLPNVGNDNSRSNNILRHAGSSAFSDFGRK